MAISKLKVVFEPQEHESVDKVVENALLTQLMVTITRIGLREEKTKNDAIIGKEKEHGSKEN